MLKDSENKLKDMTTSKELKVVEFEAKLKILKDKIESLEDKQKRTINTHMKEKEELELKIAMLESLQGEKVFSTDSDSDDSSLKHKHIRKRKNSTSCRSSDGVKIPRVRFIYFED